MMKLMIVEDNDRMRQLIRDFVAKFANQIVECSDGPEAVAIYEARRPDWVLMDVEMKGMDGITATRQIRQRFPDARIIMVTQYDDATTYAAARQSGAYGYVLKENLFELRQLLQTRKPTQQPTIEGCP
jgi:CheY-like chemotaxis protein